MDRLELEQALGSIRQAFEMRASSTALPGESATGAARLRLALAVREWASPKELLANESAGERETILDDVAPDVLAAAEAQPGRWYLDLDARTRILAQAAPDIIRKEIGTERTKSDAGDGVLWAFRAVFGLETAALEAAGSDRLRALVNAARWLAPGHPQTVSLGDQVNAILAQRSRDEDLRRLSQIRLIGRDAELRTLIDFALDPSAVEGCAYMYGVGGSGKSTLLRHFEAAVRASSRPPELLLFDLDRVDLNPADAHTLDLDLVRQLGRLRPEDAGRLQKSIDELLSVRAARRSGDGHSKTEDPGILGTDEEALILQGMGEEDSALTPLRIEDALRHGRYLAVIDTIEVAAARGPAVMRTLADWLARLAGNGVRLVLSGRDPPSDQLTEHLLKPLGEIRLVALPDLESGSAEELLRSSGLEDAQLLKLAAATLPGNPLLLRMAAGLYKDPAAASRAKPFFESGAIDPEVARRYLDERLVRHLPDRNAQPFLLPALLMPRLDLPLLSAAVVPAVDSGRIPTPREARKLLNALARSNWLATMSADGKSLSWSSAVRRLALELMAADPQMAPLIERARLLAIVYHGRKPASSDRAMAAYHRLMRGDCAEEVLARLRRPEVLAALSEEADDLPAPARLALTERLELRRVVETRPPRREQGPSDAQWLAFLEGDGKQSGEGLRLVKRGHADEALRLYRSRPTRPPGNPPLFVVKARAEEGDWGQESSDPALIVTDRVLAGIAERRQRRGRLPRDEFTRLYWLTRLVLTRDQELSHGHRRLLWEATESMSLSAVSATAGLMAVADALQPDQPPLTSRRWFQPKTPHSDPRVLLSATRERSRFATAVRLDTLIVIHPKWPDAFAQWMHQIGIKDATSASELFERLRGLDNAPYSYVANFLRSMRRPLRIHTGIADPQLDSMMLRGLTVEFHRPLATVLSRLTAGDLFQIFSRLNKEMPIAPREIRMIDRLVREKPKVWLPAFVSYCDSARLLPVLCRHLAKTISDPVPRALLRWDAALSPETDGSAWPRALAYF